ncbi:MAG: hypothetical protein QM490_06120 [Candidatus Gracilibacteria bacterium]
MIKNINEVEKSLGLEAGKLNEFFKSEDEFEIDLTSKVIFNKEDYEARVSNIKKDEFVRGRDLLLREMKDGQGLEYDGRKDPENFIKYFKEKIEAESKIEPEERFSKLKTEFEKLQNISQGFQEKYTGLEEKIKKQSKNREINNILLKSIPDNITIPKEDVLTILRAKNDFNISEDGFEIIENGVILRNETTRDPLKTDEYMKTFIKPYLKEVEGGKGGGNEGGNLKAGSFEAFEKEMDKKGISGEQLSVEMQKRIHDGTLKL